VAQVADLLLPALLLPEWSFRMVIASGGIMDGRGIVAAQALATVAAQMGTAFLACDEAATPAAWRDRLLSSTAEDTRITRVFSGRPGRAIRNRFLDEMEERDVPVPPYPLQNALTRSMSAGALMRTLAREIHEVTASLHPGDRIR
jgi:NAD(P)H-dependent flavin oxidoreductase YrpB (nitropropane dioxygenase family)